MGDLKDPRAVPALIAALNDAEEGVRLCAAEALGKIRDPGAEQRLLTSLENGEFEIVAGAHVFFMQKGETRTTDALIDALQPFEGSFGAVMAADFLHCGNSKLVEAARMWAERNSIPVSALRAAETRVVWGSRR